MDLKSGCAFEAGLEPPTQERGCYETRCLKKFGKNKSFFDQNKNKRNFQRRFNKENYNNPSNNKNI